MLLFSYSLGGFIQVKLRYILIIGLLIFGFFAVRWYRASSAAPSTPAPKVVAVTPVTRHDIRETISLIGTIQPNQSTSLLAKTPGILTILVTPGQTVAAGTLLAKVDNANVVSDQKLAANSVALYKSQYERMLTIVKKGYVSEKEVADKKQSLLQAQINLNKAKMDLDATHFYAPFAGTVSAFKIPSGSQVNPGDAILTLFNATSKSVHFDIPCSNTPNIQVGQAVVILDKHYKIDHLQNLLDEQSHMCPADVTIDCQDCLLGNSVPVELIVQEKSQALVIPFQALLIHEGQSSVYTVENNVLTLKPVKTGIQEKDQIEILTGLTSGAQLITQGQERMMAGMPVKAVVKTA